jgi:hypothetical protein
MWVPDDPRHEDEQREQDPDDEEHDLERPIPSKPDSPDATSGASIRAARTRAVVPLLLGCAHRRLRKPPLLRRDGVVFNQTSASAGDWSLPENERRGVPYLQPEEPLA